jgi:hypothetical protein
MNCRARYFTTDIRSTLDLVRVIYRPKYVALRYSGRLRTSIDGSFTQAGINRTSWP